MPPTTKRKGGLWNAANLTKGDLWCTALWWQLSTGLGRRGGGGQRKVVGNTNSRQVVGNTNSRGPCEDWSRAFEPRGCAQSGALVEKRGLPVPVIFCADLLSLRWFTVPVV